MAPNKQAPPDAAFEVYVTQGSDGLHNVAIRWTTMVASSVIALPPHVATDLAAHLPALLTTCAEQARSADTSARLVKPTPGALNQINNTRKRD